jgi:alkanesulfonate monooxygenase SsuD/methylene tetrahydromethanopterin reductase-like flavin-dependent oxidoreductase (luciferase family)
MLDRSVRSAAEAADGWMPMMFVPEAVDEVWGPALREGVAVRPVALPALEIVAGGKVAIGDDLPIERLRDEARPTLALYVGGMGARGRNFYNDVVSRSGFTDAAREIQDLYLDGKREEAAARVPDELIDRINLFGTAGQVAERVAAFRAAGVTTLMVDPVGPDTVGTIAALRELVETA